MIFPFISTLFPILERIGLPEATKSIVLWWSKIFKCQRDSKETQIMKILSETN